MDTLDARLSEMKNFFLERGYPESLVDDGIKRAKLIPKQELRKVKPKTKDSVIPFVFTHNPSNPNVTSLVRSTFEVLKSDKQMKQALKGVKYISSKRQPANLKQLLTRAKFTSSQKDHIGSHKCGDKRCGTCPHITSGSEIMIKSTQKTFSIKMDMNCKTKNVLYILTCCGCGEQYVGKTHDMLAARMRVHKQQIRNQEVRKIGVSEHIDKCCSEAIKFTVTPFYKVTEDRQTASIKEEHFIRTLKPTLNHLRLGHYTK